MHDVGLGLILHLEPPLRSMSFSSGGVCVAAANAAVFLKPDRRGEKIGFDMFLQPRFQDVAELGRKRCIVG